MSFRWLKRYLPRSLYGRAALILVLPVVVVQLVVSVSFVQRHFEGVTQQMARSMTLELGYLAEEVRRAGPDRQARIAEIADPLDLTVLLPPAEPVPEGDIRALYDLSGRALIETLRSRLEGVIAVDLSDARQVKVWQAVDGDMMQILFDRQRVAASNPHQLIVLIVVLTGLMTAIAYIYLRNQLRPVTRMARAAEAFGKGRVVPYTPSGATEVRAAGHAFLDMRNRIERQAQSRTLMLSGISHDLRTPLTRLRLGLSLLDGEEETAPLLRDVDDMQRLLDAFLDYARTDALDTLAPIDPAALLREIAGDAGRAGQAVEVAAIEASRGETVPLRPLAIRRALENLIANALRYGSRAELSLTLTDKSIRFRVEDDGPGIPPDQRDEALKPFTRLDPSRNQDQGGGVGLGLAIVSDIARLHGGILRLGESERLGGLRADIVLGR